MSESTAEILVSKTREEVAIDKLTDPFGKDKYPYMHVTKPETLESILINGIVAGEFAERAGISSYSSRFKSSWNKSYVSLVKGPIQMLWGLGIGGSDLIGVLVEPADQTIPATVERKSESDRLNPQVGHEYLVRNRIAPREIRGIVLRRNLSSNPNNLGRVIKTIEGIDTSLAVPVYREAEGLVWPIKLTREELKDRVESQI